MVNTTPANVKKIIEIDSSFSDADITACGIDAANLVVSEQLETLTPSPSAAALELIERWLSAHFWAVYQQVAAQERAGSVGEMKQYRLDRGLETTMWGTQAMALDSTGTLARWNKQMKNGTPNKVKVTWMGT